MKRAAGLLALAVLTAACTNTADTTEPTATGPAPDSSTSTTSPGTGPSSPPSDETAAEELPVLPLLGASPSFIEPGEPIEITGDARLSGELVLFGPDGELASGALQSGAGSINVPDGLSPGLYGLRLGEQDAWGTVTVVESPGLLLTGATYVRSGEAPRVEAIVHGIGTGTVVALELDSDDTVARMVPHPLLGLAPVPATSTVQGIGEGRHQLVLPEGFAGTVRLVADDPATLSDPFSEDEPTVASDELRIHICDEATSIVGDLGMAGVVTVRSAGGSDAVRSATDDGAFKLDVPAGSNLVMAVREDGANPSPQLVKVGCGASLDVGDLTEPVDTGPESGAYLGGVTSADLWEYTATASGDLEFSQEGFADCWVEDGALEVTFGASSSDPWFYTLTLQPPLDTGRYEGQLQLEDIFTQDSASGTLSGEIELGRIDDLDAIGGAFSGTVEGSLGSVDLDIRFTCGLFSLTGLLPTPSIGSGLLSKAVPMTAHLAQSGAPATSQSKCKKLFLDGRQPEGQVGIGFVTSVWAAGLASSVPRVGTLTSDEFKALIKHEAALQLLGESDSDGGGIDLGSAIESDYLLSINLLQASESWFITGDLYDLESSRKLEHFEVSAETVEAAIRAAKNGWTEMVAPLQSAGLCAEFDPESAIVDVGDTQDFTIRVTDLAGQPADSPEVTQITNSCGSWNPNSGAIDGDTWNTTFTAGTNACRETATARVEAEGTVDTVYASAETSITVEAMWQWATTITFEDENGKIVAEASGEFFVDSEFDALIGGGTGLVEGFDEARCEVNGVVSWQPFEVLGTYGVMIAGEVTERPDNAPWTIKFAPVGFNTVVDTTYRTSSDCFEAGTYRNDFVGSLGVGLLVQMPHWLNNEPDGFLTYINPAGDPITFEENLAGVPGASIRGAISKPKP